jgi:phage terminase large subunit-like protein
MFPEEGNLSREGYAKHLEFFKAGAIHKERLFMAGNRCGKTEAGSYEITCHLTGIYPDWWEGRRFDKPIMALCAGDTAQTTRDVIQTKLLGGLWQSDEWGTGMVMGECLDVKPTLKAGVPNAYEEIKVKHVSGEYSTLKFRSYDQGRRIFQGFELDLFWADEEIPKEVYDEGLMRTMTTQGMTIMTFTPLNGLTELVLSFMESMDEQVPV